MLPLLFGICIFHWLMHLKLYAQSTFIRNNTIVCDQEKDPRCYWNTDLSCADNMGRCNISCLAPSSCWGSTINCAHSNTCNVLCHDVNACDHATLNCARSERCDIQCNVGCGSITINCPENNDCHLLLDNAQGSVVHCPTNGDCFIDCPYCPLSTINCPTNGDCNIICANSGPGVSGRCMRSVVNCPLNGNCQIFCHYAGCQNAKILCPANGECQVHCTGYVGCNLIEIDGSSTSQLSIKGCHHSYRDLSMCKDMVIWCPPNVNGHKKCFIEGNNNFYGATFYAIYSWNDIDVGGYFGTMYGENSVMYCGNNYTKSCNVSAIGWDCVDQSSFCQSPPTKPPYPTSSPTLNPTNIPTTSSPTLLSLTNDPTMQPTSLPTTVPTSLSRRQSTKIAETSIQTNTSHESKDPLSHETHIFDSATNVLLIILCALILGLICIVIGIYWNFVRKKQNVEYVSVNREMNRVEECECDETQAIVPSTTHQNDSGVIDQAR
eukprot:674764_1